MYSFNRQEWHLRGTFPHWIERVVGLFPSWVTVADKTTMDFGIVLDKKQEQKLRDFVDGKAPVEYEYAFEQDVKELKAKAETITGQKPLLVDADHCVFSEPITAEQKSILADELSKVKKKAG